MPQHTVKPPEPQTVAHNFFRTYFVPAFLMLVAPPAVQFVWVVCYHHKGSLISALTTPLATLWSQFPSSSLDAAFIAAAFLLSQLILLLLVPGATFTAVPTPMGNTPKYTLNGVPCFLITHVALALLYRYGLIRYAILYEYFGPMLASLSRFALVATVFFYLRGLYMPTNSDSGTAGYGFIWDLWHGTELHPEMFGVSLKQLIICRFAMMGWSIAIVAFAMHQYEQIGYVSNSTVVSVLLQNLYNLKFFVWEGGYFNSVDIIHDRFGFYLFWGVTAFLPSIYTLTSYYLAAHPLDLPLPVAMTIAGVGIMALICNYWADRERQFFRETNGTRPIWRKPPIVIEATYETGDGKTRRSLLLASGWWGIARHINYGFEIALALCWSLPAGFTHFMPYVYVSFLTILLMDRAYRDEIRCSLKYGRFYDEYRRLVPWRMIPGVY